MSLIGRLIYIAPVFVVSFLILFAIPNQAFADDCGQKRKTPKAPGKSYKQANPLKASSVNISAGEKIYLKEAKPLACVQCHGVEGKGDGKISKGMEPKPRNFSCQGMMKGIPDGQLFWVIKNGSKGTGMMGFKTLKDDQIWQVVTYIRQFSK